MALARHQIKAVIFDCFGVLLEDGWGIIDTKLKPSQQQWQEMSKVSHQADKGYLNIDELETEFAQILNVSKTKISKIISSQRKNQPLFKLISALKTDGYKIGLISNVSRGFIADHLSKGECNLFDDMTLSFELGFTKPDRRIYIESANKLGLEPEECLFVDDRQTNIVGAEKAGMQTHLYINMPGLIGRVTELTDA